MIVVLLGEISRAGDPVRGVADREAMAWAGIIDGQSVKSADPGDAARHGYDVGKRRNGHKPDGVVGAGPNPRSFVAITQIRVSLYCYPE